MKTCFLLIVMAALAFSQTDLNGKWDVTATPEGRKPMKMDAELKHEGKEIHGTVNSSVGSGPVKNAVLGNPDLTFQFLLGKYVFDVKGVVEGDEIKGTFNGPRNMKGDFLAKRIPGPAVAPPAEGVEVGTLGGAAYRIDIPKNYNGTLVVYCHGYSMTPGRFDKDKAPTTLTKAFLDLGYGVAQSGYSTGGWAVREALEETEALRKYFVSKYGRPKWTYVAGHSMGGTITLATIESSPDVYDGALPMCGPIGPIHTMMSRRMFDTLVVYDYYFPGILGSPVQFSDNVQPGLEFLQQIQKEATTYPDRMAAFQKWSGLQSDTEMAQTVGFFAFIQKELLQRAGGNAFDNRNTIYQGSPDDAALNRGVKRYRAESHAMEYLKKYYTPRAQLKRPVLSLHTTYDPLIPAWSVNAYGDALKLNGGDDLFVQRFVGANGHCAFTPAQTIGAFQELVEWRENGKRPEAGEQK
jgi:pimeloyl-ACP methyl ester carboxylesterase